jgi:hypothetical protein
VYLIDFDPDYTTYNSNVHDVFIATHFELNSILMLAVCIISFIGVNLSPREKEKYVMSEVHTEIVKHCINKLRDIYYNKNNRSNELRNYVANRPTSWNSKDEKFDDILGGRIKEYNLSSVLIDYDELLKKYPQ